MIAIHVFTHSPRRIALIYALWFALAFPLACARVHAADTSSEALVAATSDLYQRISAHDSVGISRYIPAHGFTEFNSNSDGVHNLDMAAFESRFKAGVRFDLTVADLQVRVLGDSAIVTGTRLGSIVIPGKTPLDAKAFFTMVWSRANAQWQLQHIHLSDLAGR